MGPGKNWSIAGGRPWLLIILESSFPFSINRTWSWYIYIFLMFHWILFANITLEIFAWMLISKISSFFSMLWKNKNNITFFVPWRFESNAFVNLFRPSFLGDRDVGRCDLRRRLTNLWSWKKLRMLSELPGGPVVRTPRFHCRGHGLDPWWGTKIPRALWCGQKKKECSQFW